LIGVGGFAAAHLSSIRYCEENGLVKLEAVVIRNPKKYKEQEEQLRSKGVSIYRTPEAMFASEIEKIELISNPTGIDQHAELTIRALEYGYHVICEKPVSGTLADAGRMREAQRKTGRILAIGFQDIFSPAIQRIKAIALEKCLGQLIQSKTRVLWPRGLDYYSRNTWAGKIKVHESYIYDSPAQNAAAHFLQNMLYVAGTGRHSSAVPEYVYGENYRANNIESADTQFLRISTASECTIIFIATHATVTEFNPETEYLFTAGKITRQAGRNGLTRIMKKHGDRYRCIEEISNGDISNINPSYINTIESIQRGSIPLCTIDNTIQHTMCMDQIFADPAGIKTIPDNFLDRYNSYTVHGKKRDHPIISIKNIETITARMYEQGKSFSEIGVPWK
jgi:predicted dehydrogenase